MTFSVVAHQFECGENLYVRCSILLIFLADKMDRRNSPDTTIYNQCANIMFRYAIKSQEGHQPEAPKQLFDDETTVPDPLQREAIKVFTAGFL
jgi:hypothetical protein